MRGKIIQIKYDGYERCMGVDCYEPKVGMIWLYFIDKEYLDSKGKMQFLPNKREIDFAVSLIFVNKYKFLDDSARLEFRQPLEQSSHTQIKALVVEIINEWTMVCNIGVLGNVTVEFETKIFGVHVGKKLYFEGELQMVKQEKNIYERLL